jgi:hypothetical protein
MTVVIVCSPLSSSATIRVINQYKHHRHTKILLIDVVGNVFNDENRLLRTLNGSEHNDVLVLTILTRKLKHILNSKYHVEFSRYLSLKSSQLKHRSNESSSDSFCDLEKQNTSHYGQRALNFTSCLREIRERCSKTPDDEARSFCLSSTVAGDAFDKQLVFSENFNLFDFITSMGKDELNSSNQQFDFIVLDSKSIVNTTDDSIAFWRPLTILEQSMLDQNMFTMHHASSERGDMFNTWILEPRLINCGTLCWAILAAILLIIISLIIIISLSAGITAR